MADAHALRTKPVRLAAVGDLLLAPAPAPDGVPYGRDRRLVADEIGEVFAGCDLVFGNLECTLPGDGGCVPTEPRVVATEDLVRAVAEAGFNVVSLANNHALDCLERGFRNLRAVLDEIKLPYFGAGMDLDEATAPLILTVNGLRIAFLGAVDRRSGPSHLAAPGQFGVAPLDMDRLTYQVRELHTDVDHVIVSVHWGEERFMVPSPEQIRQAHALMEAGAAMILGHHPHVLQGTELVDGKPIAYSLGNFFADEVYFSDGDAVRWNRTGRTGAILMAELTAEGVAGVRQLPTFDPGDLVELDRSGHGERRIRQTARAIAGGVSTGRYRREHLWVKAVKPALNRLRWSELGKLRPGHFLKALRAVRGK